MKPISIALFCALAGLALGAQTTAALPAGASMTATLKGTVKASTAHVGDAVTAMVKDNVREAGAVVVPKGSTLMGKVTQAQAAAGAGSPSTLEVVFDRAVTPKGATVKLNAGIAELIGNPDALTAGEGYSMMPGQVDIAPDPANGGYRLTDPKGDLKLDAGLAVKVEIPPTTPAS